MTSTHQINSSYDQKSKKSKNKNKNKKTEEKQREKEDYTKTSVLNKYYEKTKKDSIHSLLGMDDFILLMDWRNCIHRQPQNGTDKCLILSTEHGNKRVNVVEYMQHVQSLNCDFCVIASEKISSNSSKSRCQKNVNRTMKLFEDSLSAMDTTQRSQCLIGVIEGGNDLQQRIKCLKRMSNGFSSHCIKNYAFMIGGFGFGESQKQKNEILSKVIGALNEDKVNKEKLRLVDGLDTLDDVICAISNGIDVIVSSYPTKLTLNGLAMIHSISPNEQCSKEFVDSINVCDICYASDPSPILIGCECYCCTNHSRAYLRHLFNVHEMNAQILLQMHNLHRFLKFVENIKEFMQNGKLSEFCEWWVRYQSGVMS